MSDSPHSAIVGPEDAYRHLAPHVLGAVVRRYGDFETAEDAVQEALLAAATQWPDHGVPDDPKAWLITVASRRWIDQYRSDRARDRRQAAAAARAPADQLVAPPSDAAVPADLDDTLTLLLLCCHPELTAPSQVALTLRAVGGLSTAQIARAFMVSESTMAQRISRAKQAIKSAGTRFDPPPPSERAGRLRAALHVVYLIFNEGYAATAGTDLLSPSLTVEAIRLARHAHSLLPHDGEVSGLLALMLLTDARRTARAGPDGALIPLAEQDRGQWDRASIDEGLQLITAALEHAPLGPYQLQAAIAAVHAEAASADETDWKQVLALYRLLEEMTPNPVVTLNLAVAAAMVQGPSAGLAIVRGLESDRRMVRNHRLHAVRAHLQELSGQQEGARESYLLAARLTTSAPERRYLDERAERLLAKD